MNIYYRLDQNDPEKGRYIQEETASKSHPEAPLSFCIINWHVFHDPLFEVVEIIPSITNQTYSNNIPARQPVRIEAVTTWLSPNENEWCYICTTQRIKLSISKCGNYARIWSEPDTERVMCLRSALGVLLNC